VQVPALLLVHLCYHYPTGEGATYPLRPRIENASRIQTVVLPRDKAFLTMIPFLLAPNDLQDVTESAEAPGRPGVHALTQGASQGEQAGSQVAYLSADDDAIISKKKKKKNAEEAEQPRVVRIDSDDDERTLSVPPPPSPASSAAETAAEAAASQEMDVPQTQEMPPLESEEDEDEGEEAAGEGGEEEDSDAGSPPAKIVRRAPGGR